MAGDSSGQSTTGSPRPTVNDSPRPTVQDSSRPTDRGSSRATPWHREPLVWMVLAIPAAAVVVGTVMLVLANVTWDGLVTDDYYRRGMEINRSLARDAEASRLGLRASVAFPAPGVVEARIADVDGTATASVGDRLHLHFARASRAGNDVRILMTRDTIGTWRGTLPAMTPGKWYVELGDEQWRLAAALWMPVSSGELVLHAADGPGSAHPSPTPETQPQS